MAATVVQICNMALAHIGVTKLISSLTETSTEAQQCNLFYEIDRDCTLEDFPWSFAERQAALTLSDVDPPEEWTYCYDVPTECVKPRAIATSWTNAPRADERITFRAVANPNGTGRLIWTHQEDAILVYTARIENPVAFPALFAYAVSRRMALDLSSPLSDKPERLRALWEMYQTALSAARVASLGSGRAPQEPDSTFVTGRE